MLSRHVDLKPSRDVSARMTPWSVFGHLQREAVTAFRKNRKIGQADPLVPAYTLAWRNYDPLETRRTVGGCKLADSFRRLIYTVPVEAVERSAVRYIDGLGCSLDGRGVAQSLFSKSVCVG